MPNFIDLLVNWVDYWPFYLHGTFTLPFIDTAVFHRFGIVRVYKKSEIRVWLCNLSKNESVLFGIGKGEVVRFWYEGFYHFHEPTSVCNEDYQGVVKSPNSLENGMTY